MRFTSTFQIFCLFTFGAAAQLSITIPQIQGTSASSFYVTQQVVEKKNLDFSLIHRILNYEEKIKTEVEFHCEIQPLSCLNILL